MGKRVLISSQGMAAAEEVEVVSEALSDCQRWRARALEDPTVAFMLSHMKKAGCGIPESAVYCVPKCEGEVRGGFHPANGILLCANAIYEYEQVRETITHELVHAYDECRAYMDWTDCVKKK